MNRGLATPGCLAAMIGGVAYALGAIGAIAAAPARREASLVAPSDAPQARAAELRRDAGRMRDLARILDEQGKTDVAAQLREDADAAEAEAGRLVSSAASEPPPDRAAAPPARRAGAEGRRTPPPDAGAQFFQAAPDERAVDRPPKAADDPLAAVDLLYEAAAKLRATGMRREAARVTRLALKIEARIPHR